MGKILQTDEMIDVLERQNAKHGNPVSKKPTFQASPYSSKADSKEDGRHSKPVVFVTARFRTGSTLIWNILRSNKENTVFYEPLHPNINNLATIIDAPVDNTHAGVDSYWDEYALIENINELHKTRWHDTSLYMDEESYDPDLVHYIDTVIKSSDKTVILQFNRVDFRLRWLRKYFKNAKILHLYRNPRDQWLSTLKYSKGSVSNNILAKDFIVHDKFFLLIWCRDLAPKFQFLTYQPDRYAYDLFYLLWRLSYIYGESDADYSMCFEDLVNEPRDTINDITTKFDLQPISTAELAKINRNIINKSNTIADLEWMLQREAICETQLSHFFNHGY
nr:sulfotransferase [uncultured Glaciecola sp.]